MAIAWGVFNFHCSILYLKLTLWLAKFNEIQPIIRVIGVKVKYSNIIKTYCSIYIGTIIMNLQLYFHKLNVLPVVYIT